MAASRTQILSLYKRILFAAARFPSKNRDRVYGEIRDEFRRNATLTGAEAEAEVTLAQQSLRQLEARPRRGTRRLGTRRLRGDAARSRVASTPRRAMRSACGVVAATSRVGGRVAATPRPRHGDATDADESRRHRGWTRLLGGRIAASTRLRRSALADESWHCR